MKKLYAITALSLALFIAPTQAKINKKVAKENAQKVVSIAATITKKVVLPAGEIVAGVGSLWGAKNTTLKQLNATNQLNSGKTKAPDKFTLKFIFTNGLKQVMYPNSKLPSKVNPTTLKRRGEIARDVYAPMALSAGVALDGARRIATNACQATQKAYALYKEKKEAKLLS